MSAKCRKYLEKSLASLLGFDIEDIVDIINYLHNAFPGDNKRIDVEKVKELRNSPPKNGSLYTEDELLSIFK